jgi:hypothetical protein
MKQVFQPKGGESTGTKRQAEAWARRIEHDVTKLGMVPITTSQRTRVIAIARHLDSLAREALVEWPRAILGTDWQPADLPANLATARERLKGLRREMVAWQEELDWTVYVAFGLADQMELVRLEEIEPLASEHRPFAIRLARLVEAGGFEGTPSSPPGRGHW